MSICTNMMLCYFSDTHTYTHIHAYTRENPYSCTFLCLYIKARDVNMKTSMRAHIGKCHTDARLCDFGDTLYSMHAYKRKALLMRLSLAVNKN